MSSTISASRWQCAAPDAIVWREWNGEFVVRDDASGSSHLLGTLAGRVLQVLLGADRPLAVEEIASLLGDRSAAADFSEELAAIDEVLSAFHRLELATPAHP